jgi:4a-hydroxytetrahydrobiopterin dehydratase
MADDLAQKTCVPCHGGVPPLPESEVNRLLGQLSKGWHVVEGREIAKVYLFNNFVEAVDFVNAITPIAEQEGHHPDLEVGWGRVAVHLRTHAIDGLTENDFILAAKIDQLSPRPA